MLLQGIFFALSFILTLLFFLYGFNHYYLLNEARRYEVKKQAIPTSARPRVSIHLPIYNERYVVRRIVQSCVRMAESYGIDLVKILIIDDSDDETALEINKIVEEFSLKKVQIEVLRREGRQGFKAGALQEALNKTPEEFIAVFDADFVPPADFLIRTVPVLDQNEKLGIIQTRWGHLNRNFNPLTKAVAIAIDIHFLVEQAGRYAAGLFQNFNGSGGVLRKKAMLEAGGWQSDTIAEDLDLSYRIQLLGYRVQYLRDIVCPGEIPPTLPSLRKQQGRWANGSLRTAKKILPRFLSDPSLKLRQRFQGFIHLTGYMIHPLMALSFLLNCLSTFLGLNPLILIPPLVISSANGLLNSFRIAAAFSIHNLGLLFLGPLILLCTVAPWVSSVSTLRLEKLPLWRNLTSLLLLLMIGFGLSLNNTLEAGKALLSNRSWEFARTPKYADLKSKSGWQTRKYQVSLSPMSIVEGGFASLGIFASGFAAWHSNYLPLLILIPFTISYVFIFIMTILQSRRDKPSGYD